MSQSFTLESWMERGLTAEALVRIIRDTPQLSKVVGDSLAYNAAQMRCEKEPDEAADWERKATRYLLENSIKEYARSVGEEGASEAQLTPQEVRRRLSARARARAAHRAATGE
ncbi:hypothetical protein ABT124_02475 [Streptomyces sp. NPDC001982]|uniref:hypothetical protein n=1 Tax=unclassified Streptomyces TaxID=2593676 RepID=UPI00332E47FE